MQILINSKGWVIAYAPCIEFGIYDESFEKWALFDTDNKDTRRILMYVVDNKYTLVNDIELPEDYFEGKYYFKDGEFILNENWEPSVTIEERINNIEIAVEEQKESSLLLSEELLNAQLALAEQYESNIITEEELVNTQLALAEQYETNIALEEELTSTKEELNSAQNEITELQLAICDLYELMG